jgi:hypothetical protein
MPHNSRILEEQQNNKNLFEEGLKHHSYNNLNITFPIQKPTGKYVHRNL